MTPSQGGYLALPPPARIRESGEVLQVIGEGGDHAVKLLTFEEVLPGVVLRPCTNTLEPLRQGVRHAFGTFRKDVARILAVRCDWGPQYIADAWINEVKWLGITISPSYVGEPEGHGSPSASFGR